MKQLLQRVKAHYQLALIFLMGIGIRLYMAAIDPFLHEWDERYHALVARNMMKNPLKPMLIAKPFALYDPDQWCCNHIWLHKQPLFLWQMALSMKLFGVSECTLRLPSVLMGSAMILLVYRIAMLLTANKLTAILAALLMCCSHFQLELISGKNGMDHNDVAFGFYVLASTWSYLEYLKRPTWYWAVATGLFSGCAILNKWLTGLLIFLPWGVKVVCAKSGKRLSTYGHFFLGLLVCISIFLPWQLFILHAYPSEARYEFALNARHIWEAVERHARDNWFYYDNFKFYFGELNYYLLIPGIFILLLKYTQKRIEAMTLIGMLLLMFVFFTFIVRTKMISYFFVVAPVGFIMIAISLERLITLARSHTIVQVALIALCLFKVLDPLDIYASRQNNPVRQNLLLRTVVYKNLHNLIPADTRILINVPVLEHPDVMFYNEGLTAYQYYPFVESGLEILRQIKTPVATFKERPGYNLPYYIRGYPYLCIVDADLP